ncbi:stonustoxin subunit beta-like [Haplochromis burtoni]|uniref:stonustoxin subunit beta-like n=1 Tax=Haplochromis burtoni TaxID=8153 RepID=UPI001C2D527C|nr:stonustoxin subunit beta-like [Haplochromis burtoni]
MHQEIYECRSDQVSISTEYWTKANSQTLLLPNLYQVKLWFYRWSTDCTVSNNKGFFSLSDSCELTLDPNTANRNLILFDNNTKVAFVDDEQPYPDHPERFDDWKQILCRNGLTGRCYWEVEWEGWVYIAVSYRGIRRTGASKGCWFGWNNQSWSLRCSEDGYFAWHNNTRTDLSTSSSSFVSSSASSTSSTSNRVAVYVDCPAGTLSFYRVSSNSLIHLHTFSTTFTETLYPGFRLFRSSSVSLCSL